MARISQQFKRIWQKAIPEDNIPEIKMDYYHLLHGKGRRKCLITGQNKPLKWGMYHDDSWWYVISSHAVLHTSWTEWLIGLWIAFGDAILDGEPTTEGIDVAVKHILTEIEYGIRYAIESDNKSK